MKFKFTLASLLLFSVLSFSQSNWTEINTGYSFILTNISFPGNQDSIGYAVGMSSTYNGNGIILKTTNGGSTWSQISTGTLPGLEAMYFTSVDTGYIGGWQNYFAKTTNGGLTWTPSTVNAGIWYITNIAFYDGQNGIVTAAGSEAYVTSNGGQTWTAATGLAVNAQDISYASANVVYIVGGDEKIARSTNGGLGWTTIHTGMFQMMFLGVNFYNEQYGIVGGEDGKVLRTSNGGQTWQTSYVPGNPLLRAAYMQDSLNAIIAGTPEGIYITNDGGATWASDYMGGFSFAIYDADFSANGTGFICGSQGRIWKKAAPIVADFSAANTFSCTPDSFFFSDQSTGAIDIWLWDFPGGNPSFHNGQTPPGIYYGAPGSYDVQLTIISGSQSDTILMNSLIEIEVQHNFQITGTTFPGSFVWDFSTLSIPGYSYLWLVSPTGTIINQGNSSIQIVVPTVGVYSVIVVTESANGCRDTSDQRLFTAFASVDELDNSIKIYPNPTSGIMNISISKQKEMNYSIMNMTGQLVKAGLCTETVDFSDLESGLYILELQDVSGLYRQRVMKQ
jgi:photosystem II stability/assembly factor-like uncharacterized protein